MSLTRASIDRKLDALAARTTRNKTLRASAAAAAVIAAALGVWWWRHRSAVRRAEIPASAPPWARASETSGYAVDPW